MKSAYVKYRFSLVHYTMRSKQMSISFMEADLEKDTSGKSMRRVNRCQFRLWNSEMF